MQTTFRTVHVAPNTPDTSVNLFLWNDDDQGGWSQFAILDIPAALVTIARSTGRIVAAAAGTGWPLLASDPSDLRGEYRHHTA